MVWELFRALAGVLHYFDRRILVRHMKESEDPDLWWKYGIDDPPGGYT